MKKTFMKFAAFSAAALFALASCDKDGDDEKKNNGGLKDDDTEQTQPGGDTGTTPEDPELPASLQGSSYVVISLDEFSTEAIQNKIKASYQLDDTNVFFYVWDNTYAGGASSGVNFYGEAAGWTSLVVGSVGWSGGGWCVVNPETIPPFVDNAADIANWKFHIGYKGAAGVAHIIVLYWNGGEYKFAIGDGSLADGGVTYDAITPVGGTFQPNAWNEYEIRLAETGFDYTQSSKGNIAAVLSGGVAGITCDIDAVFFYKN